MGWSTTPHPYPGSWLGGLTSLQAFPYPRGPSFYVKIFLWRQRRGRVFFSCAVLWWGSPPFPRHQAFLDSPAPGVGFRDLVLPLGGQGCVMGQSGPAKGRAGIFFFQGFRPSEWAGCRTPGRGGVVHGRYLGMFGFGWGWPRENVPPPPRGSPRESSVCPTPPGPASCSPPLPSGAPTSAARRSGAASPRR